MNMAISPYINMAIRDAYLRPLTFALGGAPPRTFAKRALLIGASVLQRVVRRHFALNARPVLATGMPECDDFKVLASRTVVDEVAGSR